MLSKTGIPNRTVLPSQCFVDAVVNDSSFALVLVFLYRSSTGELKQLDRDATSTRWCRPVNSGAAFAGLTPDGTTISVSGAHPRRADPPSSWRSHPGPSSGTRPASSSCRCRTDNVGAASTRLLPDGTTWSSSSANRGQPQRTHPESSWRSHSGSKWRIHLESSWRSTSGSKWRIDAPPSWRMEPGPSRRIDPPPSRRIDPVPSWSIHPESNRRIHTGSSQCAAKVDPHLRRAPSMAKLPDLP